MKMAKRLLLILSIVALMVCALVVTASAADTTKTYTFSDYTAGTQYATNEEHVLDSDITCYTTESHFTSELRLYSSSTHDGYAVFQSTNDKPITAVGFNAGNKADTLNVYGSINGEDWTLIQGVIITTTSYTDYTVSGDFSANYTYIKLDVAGSNQVRVKSITLTLGDATSGGEVVDPNVAKVEEAISQIETAIPETNLTSGDMLPLPIGVEISSGEEVAVVWSITSEATTGSATLENGVFAYTLPNEGEADGKVTITATVTIGDVTDTKDFVITLVAPVTPSSDVWALVTDASSLNAGDKIIIVANAYDYALSTTQNKNNRGQAAVTKVGDTISFGDDVQIITLEVGTVDGTFSFNVGDGYLYAASSSNNYLRIQTANDENSSWLITITDGVASVVAQGTNTRNTMQYNQSSSIFASYASASQKAISIYKLETTTSGGDETPVEKTDAEKAQADLAAIGIDTTVTKSGSVTLPLIGGSYESAITWASNSELAVVDNTAGTVTYTVPAAGEADVTVTLTATAVNGDATETKTFEITLDAPLKPLDAFVPVEGIGYKFAMLHTTNEKTYYINGSMNGYYMATTTDSDSAAIVYIENTDDGFYMYTFVDGSKKYMNMTVSSNYVNATFDDTASTVYTYSTEINGPVAIVNSTEYGFGTYNTYTTVGTSKTSFAGSSTNYYGQFVEPENPITFEGAALNINSNIDMMYYVSIAGEPTTVSATYVFNGVTTTVTECTIGEDGRYCFVFEGINPHQMADVVDVTISATYDETTYTANNATMSVRAYYEIAKEYLAEDTKLLTLISDLLVYGAAAQTYVGDTDALVTEGLELTPTTTEFVAPESVFASTGEAFKSATLYLDHAVTVRFTVEAAEDAVIRVTLNDKVQEYNVADLAKDGEDRYIVEFVDVYATEYAGTITATVVGTEDSVTYSVNSYISEMADADDANLVALVKALYTYGATARNYN